MWPAPPPALLLRRRKAAQKVMMRASKASRGRGLDLAQAPGSVRWDPAVPFAEPVLSSGLSLNGLLQIERPARFPMGAGQFAQERQWARDVRKLAVPGPGPVHDVIQDQSRSGKPNSVPRGVTESGSRENQ